MEATGVCTNRFLCFAILLGLAACSGTQRQNDAVELSNPASTYCISQGGTNHMARTASGIVGQCRFPDGSVCDEWSYYRKQCGPGQIFKSAQASDNRWRFRCDGDVSFTLSYLGVDKAVLERDGKAYLVYQMPTASGVHYSDGLVGYRGKGNKGQLIAYGDKTFGNCFGTRLQSA
ncbi:MAG: DUF333 domain-containing protein [Pseudomonadota bacterium]